MPRAGGPACSALTALLIWARRERGVEGTPAWASGFSQGQLPNYTLPAPGVLDVRVPPAWAKPSRPGEEQTCFLGQVSETLSLSPVGRRGHACSGLHAAAHACSGTDVYCLWKSHGGPRPQKQLDARTRVLSVEWGEPGVLLGSTWLGAPGKAGLLHVLPQGCLGRLPSRRLDGAESWGSQECPGGLCARLVTVSSMG